MHAVTAIFMALVASAYLVLPAVAAEPNIGLVRDIRATGGSDPHYLTQAAGRVFFTASDGVHGKELWVSDGSALGTRMLRDIHPGVANSSPRRLTRVGSRLYFTASDGVHGRELWASDGTPGGTRLVKDLTKGAKGSFISGIAAAAGTAYFEIDRRDLWRSDGTSKGTAPLRTFAGLTLAQAVAVGPTLYYSADGGLWRSDGTSAGTRRLTLIGIHADELTRYHGRIYFRLMPDSGHGAEPTPELWRSDGTKAGTKRLVGVLDPGYLTVMGGTLYLDARQPSKVPRLFASDGTSPGTAPVKPWTRPLWNMLSAAGRLWASDESKGQWGEPDRLWVSDGSAAGTSLVHGGNEDWFTSDWKGLDCAALDGRIWFAAGPGADGKLTDHELWSSDGTAAGTVEAADLNVKGSSFPRDFVKLGQIVLFSADDGEHGRELWSLALP